MLFLQLIYNWYESERSVWLSRWCSYMIYHIYIYHALQRLHGYNMMMLLYICNNNISLSTIIQWLQYSTVMLTSYSFHVQVVPLCDRHLCLEMGCFHTSLLLQTLKLKKEDLGMHRVWHAMDMNINHVLIGSLLLGMNSYSFLVKQKKSYPLSGNDVYLISPLGWRCVSHIPSRATMCISYPLLGSQVYLISPLGQSSVSYIPS